MGVGVGMGVGIGRGVVAVVIAVTLSRLCQNQVRANRTSSSQSVAERHLVSIINLLQAKLIHASSRGSASAVAVTSGHVYYSCFVISDITRRLDIVILAVWPRLRPWHWTCVARTAVCFLLIRFFFWTVFSLSSPSLDVTQIQGH